MNEHDANLEHHALTQLVLEAAGLDVWENNLVTGEVTRKALKTFAELGYGEEEAASYFDDFEAVIHPDDFSTFKKSVSDHLIGVTAEYRCEFRLRAKWGEWIWYANYAKFMENGNSQRGQRLIGVTFNINDRKRKEEKIESFNQQLTEQNTLLNEMQSIAGLGTYVLDIATGRWKSSHLLDALLGIDAAFDYSLEGWVTLLHPDERAMMIGYLETEVFAQGNPFDREYRIIRHNDKAERWIHGVGKLEFDTQGQPARMIGVIQDITETREREAELAASRERLREVEKSQLLSQERQRLMQDMHDGLGSSLNSALRVVEHGRMNADEVAEILKDCLDDLKLTIDSMEPVEADLLLLLATLRYRLEPRLEATGIVLRWEIQLVPKLDWLDPRNALHILRILQEAFTNIIKHAHATEIRVATAIEGARVTVTITDNGRGFDTSRAAQGRGHGLANQARRAKSIGAKVQLASDATGTRLTLHLPIKLS